MNQRHRLHKIIGGGSIDSNTVVFWEPVWGPLPTTGVLMMGDTPLSNIAPLVLVPEMWGRQTNGIEHWGLASSFKFEGYMDGISILRQIYGEDYINRHSRFLETFYYDVWRAKRDGFLPNAPININRLQIETWLMMHFARQVNADATELDLVSPLVRMEEYQRLFAPERAALEQPLFADQPYQGNITYWRSVSQTLWNNPRSLLNFFGRRIQLTPYEVAERLRAEDPTHPLLIREIAYHLELLKRSGDLQFQDNRYFDSSVRYRIQPSVSMRQKPVETAPRKPQFEVAVLVEEEPTVPPAPPSPPQPEIVTAEPPVATVRAPKSIRPSSKATRSSAQPIAAEPAWKLDDKVSHPIFGAGTIGAVIQRGGEAIVTVAFDNGSTKTLNATLARLTKI